MKAFPLLNNLDGKVGDAETLLKEWSEQCYWMVEFDFKLFETF